jgi:hypothetical protein
MTMFVQQPVPGLFLRERPDRRARERFEHRHPVQINGRYALARDISPKGLSVVMAPALVVGDVVRVTLPEYPGERGEVTTPARVARIEPQAGRCILGLEFVQ